MTVSPFAHWIVLLGLGLFTVAHAQQEPLVGLPVPPLGAGPFLFDTAEAHKVRVSVVTKGLSHP